MSKINLIPEVKQQKQKIHRLNTMVSSIATLAGVVLGIAVVLILVYNGILSTQISSTNGKITKAESSIKTMKDLETQVVNLENGLRNIKSIVDSNKSWTKFFGEIEKATPSDVQFLSFTMSGNQVTASLKGKEVRSIDRFIASFSTYKNSNDEKLFESVSVNGYNKKDTGEFLFQAKFNVNGAAAW